MKFKPEGKWWTTPWYLKGIKYVWWSLYIFVLYFPVMYLSSYYLYYWKFRKLAVINNWYRLTEDENTMIMKPSFFFIFTLAQSLRDEKLDRMYSYVR